MQPRLSLSSIVFSVVLMLAACTKPDTTNRSKAAQIQHIDSLIVFGKKYLSGGTGIDTLNNTAQQLITIAANSGNRKALVYGQLYQAGYEWLAGNAKKAMELAVQSLANAEKYNIKTPLPSIYSVIGNLHKENSNFNLAFDAARNDLYWAKINKDTTAIISAMNLMAMFMHTKQEALNLPPVAASVNLQQEALQLAGTNPKYVRLRIILYDNMISYYLYSKDYENAIRYGLIGVNLATKYNQQRSLTYSCAFLGQAYLETGNQQLGLSYLTRALQIARKLKQPYREMEIYDNLYGYYYHTGDYKMAMHYNILSSILKDSLEVTKNEKQMSELELKYQTDKKNREIAQIDHDRNVKNRLLLAVLGGCLVLIVLSVILLKLYRTIKHNNTAIQKSNVNKDKALVDIAYIQSHELRRPLASILGLINVIKTMDDNVDPECLNKLEEAGLELDNKIHAIIAYVDTVKAD